MLKHVLQHRNLKLPVYQMCQFALKLGYVFFEHHGHIFVAIGDGHWLATGVELSELE